MDKGALRRDAAQLGIQLSDAQLERFEEFESRLYEANSLMNLTRVPREECATRHFVDSLLFADLIPEGSKVVDIGTGPGFPAWPIACARPDLDVTAIDSSGKMLGFLSRNLLPNMHISQVRAEEFQARESFDVVTGRAVAPLAVQLEISAHLCKIGGIILPMRTPTDEPSFAADAGQLGLQLESVQRRELPGTDVVRVFPIYRKFGATPGRYPRTWAEIKRRPLF